MAHQMHEPGTEWTPTIDARVILYPGTDRETSGRIIEDFGEFTAHSVEINDTHIADPARRWAVITDTGSLEFLDTTHLGPPHITSATDAETDSDDHTDLGS